MLKVTFIRKKTLISVFLAVFFITLPDILMAASAKNTFFKAEICYRSLVRNKKAIKYRENWLKCIRQFDAAYKKDTRGPWAPASLYMSGKLYQELYRWSGRYSDKQEAIKKYSFIIKNFTKSRYRSKAQDSLKNLLPKIDSLYQKAVKSKKSLYRSRTKQKYRQYWIESIKKFQDVFKKSPYGTKASESLYTCGELYYGLYKRSGKKSDLAKAIDIYERVTKRYPSTLYSRKASANLKKIKPKTKTGYAYVDKSPKKTETLAVATSNNKATVNEIRHWSNPNYTRIVIHANNPVSFNYHLLKKNTKLDKPQRLFIDLNNAKIDPGLKRAVTINDHLLSSVRAAQYKTNVVRVVIDIKSFKSYKIFSLNSPFRIVADIEGFEGASGSYNVEADIPKLPSGSNNINLVQQFSLGVRRIIIDPGHGGRDGGAPGYIRKVYEKDVNLKIAKILADKIKKELNCEVLMTRSNDRYLTLEERTAFANTRNADIFISIHTNAARKRGAYGIETYFLNLATDPEAILVAARENATSTKNISDLGSILDDLMRNAKIDESKRLAKRVQSAMCGKLSKHYSKIKDKGVKQAPFYVLLGAKMPSILVETSFISNPRECKRLTNHTYISRLCDGIVNGLKTYISDIKQN